MSEKLQVEHQHQLTDLHKNLAQKEELISSLKETVVKLKTELAVGKQPLNRSSSTELEQEHPDELSIHGEVSVVTDSNQQPQPKSQEQLLHTCRQTEFRPHPWIQENPSQEVHACN